MGFFDDLGVCIANSAREVGEKAVELGGIAKLHTNIKAEKIKMQEYYYKIGKEYYTKKDELENVQMEGFMAVLDECKRKIDLYTQQLAEAKENSKKEK